MKAVVSKYLNVRSGEPKVLPNNNIGNKFFKPGDPIEIAAKVEGETYKGNNVWYKLTDGTFVWSGGVDSSVAIPTGASNMSNAWSYIKEKMSWAHDSVDHGGLGVVDLWNALQSRGAGVSIGVIDTGLTTISGDFGNVEVTAFRDVFDAITDDDGHGTNCTSIAAATGKGIFYGVAPDANLYHYKCFASKNYQISADFNIGLKDLLTKDWPLDILSISFCFKNMDQDTLVIIEQLSKKYIIFAAVEHGAGDVIVSGINNNQIPGCLENVIPVCALTKQNVPMPANLLINKNIYAVACDIIECIGNNGRISKNGQSSIATPFVAGFFAIIISYFKKRGIDINTGNFNRVLDFFSVPLPYSINGNTINLYRVDSTKAKFISQLENQLL